jgi:hypothetical protein
VGVIQVHLLEDAVPTQYGAPFLVTADSNGLFRFELTCHFVGPGRHRLSDPQIQGDGSLLNEVELYCGLSPEERGPSTPALSALPAIGTAAATDPPVTANGRVAGFRYEQRSHQINARTSSLTEDELTVTVETFSRSTMQKCTQITDTCNRCQSGVCQRLCCIASGGSTCTNERRIDVCQAASFSNETPIFLLHNLTFSSPSFSSVNDASIEMTWEFPSLAQGAQITRLDVLGRRSNGPLEITHPLEAHLMSLVEDGTATPSVPDGFARAASFCPVTSFVGQATWEFPAPIPESSPTLRMDSEPSCRFDNGAGVGVSTVLISAFRARAEAGAPLALELMPSDEAVAPTNERFPDQPNRLGQSSTTLTATLSGATPQREFTVRVRGQGFDAEAAGHAHGSPPEQFWGALGGNAGSPGSPPETTCSLTSDSEGTGSCTVPFQADRVAGDITFLAEVEGEPITAQALVRVEVPGIVSVSTLFARDFELHFLATDAHPDSFNFKAELAGELQALQRGWEEETQSYLSFNDMSVMRGGVLDLNRDRKSPHRGHREGRSVDINRQRFDVAAEGTPKLPRIELDEDDPLRQVLGKRCKAVGARLLPRREDPNSLHCEF